MRRACRRWSQGAGSLVRAATFWVLMAGALGVPLWNHEWEFQTQAEARRLGEPCTPLTPSNRAAVVVGRWIRNGQLTGFRGDSPAVCLRVPAGEWASLSPGERVEVWRDISLIGQVSQAGRPVYVRDEQDRVMFAGTCQDTN